MRTVPNLSPVSGIGVESSRSADLLSVSHLCVWPYRWAL
jgi:hypothetical protein